MFCLPGTSPLDLAACSTGSQLDLLPGTCLDPPGPSGLLRTTSGDSLHSLDFSLLPGTSLGAPGLHCSFTRTIYSSRPI